MVFQPSDGTSLISGRRPRPPTLGAPGPSSREVAAGAGVVGVFLLGFSMVFIAAQPLGDPDIWWHLVMGHAYLDGATVRHPGSMSPFGTADWHSRDWLTQVLMAVFDRAFGLAGVAWLHGLGLVALFLACFHLCRRHVAFGPAALATTTAYFAMIGSLSPRPQVVSFILFAVVLGALLRTVDDLRPRWWLVPVTALWACCHGMWFLAPGLQLVVMIGILLDRRTDLRGLRPHALLLALSLAAVALTPNGLQLLSQPTGPSMGIAHFIQEYRPSSLTFPPYAAALIMAFAICASWARRGGAPWVDVLLVGLGIFLTLYGARTIPLGAVLMAPFFARAVASWWPGVRAFTPVPVERAVVYGSAAATLGALALMVPSSSAAPDDYFPVTYDDRLSSLPRDAVLINELGDGGFLAWKYPELRIVGDGLTDQYEVEWLDGWFRALGGEPGWDEFVERSGAEYALLEDDTPLRLGLLSLEWSVVQHEEGRVLLKAPDD
jgi:hypothetical protein